MNNERITNVAGTATLDDTRQRAEPRLHRGMKAVNIGFI